MLPAAASRPERPDKPDPSLESQPMIDRLAIPVLPDDPTQIDIGNSVYYYNCMPCHGDVGQGLTDEFRQIWVEDHQNCWASGCHGGRDRDEGFPLPRAIPDVLGLEYFHTPEDLFQYLQTTHPPQRPGALTEEEYWSATAFLLNKSGRLAANEKVGVFTQEKSGTELWGLLIFLVAVVVTSWLLIQQTRQNPQNY